MVKPLVEPRVDDVVRLKMTYQDYLDRFDEDARVEWANGEAIVYMPPNEPHQDAVTLLATLLRFYVDLRDLGMVLVAPFELSLPTGSSREPDIVFLSRAHYHRRTIERWHGPADLAVEAQSASTARYVLNEKFRDYERSGVREFWIFDTRPGHQSFRAFALTESGGYEELPLDPAGRFHSIVLPGFWLDPTWFRHDPLPKAHELISAIAPDVFNR